MQQTLTKTYRLLWNSETKEIMNTQYKEENHGQTTFNDTFWAYFESDDYSEIEQKIEDEGLIEPETEE